MTSSTETVEAPTDLTTLPETDPENGSDGSGDQSQIIEATSSLALPLAAEPVLPPVANERFVNPGAMVEHQGRLEVFANSFSAFPGPSVVHRLTSEDGLDWNLTSDEPILTSDDVPYTEGNAFLYSVDITDDGWVGWFYTYEGALREGVIGRATAPAPEGPWSVDPEPVLVPGADDAWDGGRLTEPSVARDGEGYLMLYGGRDRSENSAIGLATSPDGINWTKADGPVVSPDGVWDSDTIARPRVIRHDNGWLLVYAAVARATGSVGIATSADGVNWSPYPDNPILTRGDLPGSLFQYGVVPYQDRLLWLFEAGSGSSGTALYPLELLPPDAAAVMGVTATVEGGTVDVKATIDSVDLRFVRGDSSGDTAHTHVYVDRPPPTPGEEVPLGDPTIVHAPGDTVTVEGLEPGDHTLWVVLADGEDRVMAPPTPVRLDVTIGS